MSLRTRKNLKKKFSNLIDKKRLKTLLNIIYLFTRKLDHLLMTAKKSDEEKIEKLSELGKTQQLKVPQGAQHEKTVIDSISKKIDKVYENQALSQDPSKPEIEGIASSTSFSVRLSSKAYERIVGYAIRYANNKLKKEDWREVYGILIGEVEDKKLVIVKNAIPVCVGGRTGVELEPIHYVDLSQIDEFIYENDLENKKTDFIVGWWHSHPGFGFFFSSVDRETQLGYQIPNPFAVGLIFDHRSKTSDFLGIRALRLLDPSKGIASEYDTVEIEYEQEKNDLIEKTNKIIEDIFNNMDKVISEIDNVENNLLKIALPSLQKKYGLLFGPRSEIKGVIDDEDPDMDKSKLYVWYPEAFTKKYLEPKLRLKIESEIKKCEENLKHLLKNQQLEKYEELKKKSQAKINEMLAKPNNMITSIMDEFFKKKEIVDPYYDYLDTNERKVIEHFEEWISDYFKVLDGFKVTIANF